WSSSSSRERSIRESGARRWRAGGGDRHLGGELRRGPGRGPPRRPVHLPGPPVRRGGLGAHGPRLAGARPPASFASPGWRVGGRLVGGFIRQTGGLQFTTPSRRGFLPGLSVLLVPLVGVLLFRKWPSPPVLLGVALAVAGLWFLTGGMSNGGGETAKGDLLTIACAIAFAFYIVLLEPAARRHRSTPLGAAPLWVVALLALLALPFVPRHLVASPALWWAVLYTGVLSTAVCLLAQTWAQARTSAVRAALIFALEPVFAATWSVLVGRERLGTRE